MLGQVGVAERATVNETDELGRSTTTAAAGSASLDLHTASLSTRFKEIAPIIEAKVLALLKEGKTWSELTDIQKASLVVAAEVVANEKRETDSAQEFAAAHVPLIGNLKQASEAADQLAKNVLPRLTGNWAEDKLTLLAEKDAIDTAYKAFVDLGEAVPPKLQLLHDKLQEVDGSMAAATDRAIAFDAAERQLGEGAEGAAAKVIDLALAQGQVGYALAAANNAQLAAGLSTEQLKEKVSSLSKEEASLEEKVRTRVGTVDQVIANELHLREVEIQLAEAERLVAEAAQREQDELSGVANNVRELSGTIGQLDGAMTNLASNDIDLVQKAAFKMSESQQKLHDGFVQLISDQPLVAATLGRTAALFREGAITEEQFYVAVRDFLSSQFATLASPDLLGKVQALFSAFKSGSLDAKGAAEAAGGAATAAAGQIVAANATVVASNQGVVASFEHISATATKTGQDVVKAASDMARANRELAKTWSVAGAGGAGPRQGATTVTDLLVSGGFR
jgi:hypothetical protein